MAEVIGIVASGITLAGLLKACLEAFEIVQVARKRSFDFDKCCLQLNIERARLYTWGQTLGLTSDDSQRTMNRLKDCQFEALIIDALRMILSIFEDGERLKKRYGCSSSLKQAEKGNFVTDTTHSTMTVISAAAFAESFGNFGIRNNHPGQMTRLSNKARWIIEDRTKFFDLILDIRSLIDGLQDITKSVSTIARQEAVLRYGVQQIRDPDSLNLLTAVCQDDYPDISDAASTKLDVMTMSTHKLETIEVWMDSTNGESTGLENDLESMSITELQQLVRTLTAQDTHNNSGISGDTLYDDHLQQRDRKIMEQEALIQKLTTAAASQDQLISQLRAQTEDRDDRRDLQDRNPRSISVQRQHDPKPENISNEVSDLSVSATTERIREVIPTEIFRSLRSFHVTQADSTSIVLRAALQKYNISGPWYNYALFIVHGDQERRCGLADKPLLLFQNLEKQGLNPMVKLRKYKRSPYVSPIGSTSTSAFALPIVQTRHDLTSYS